MRKTTILVAAFAAVLTADGPAQAQTASCERAKAKHGAENVQCSSNPETVRTDPARDEVHDTITLIRKPTWAVLQGLDTGAAPVPGMAGLGARGRRLPRPVPAAQHQVDRAVGLPLRPRRSGAAHRLGGEADELMAEVAAAGEHHRQPVLVGGGDDLFVAA